MPVRKVGGHSASWGSLEEAELEEERLVDLLQGSRVLADGGGEGRESNRSSPESLHQSRQDGEVDAVEPLLVHLEQGQGIGRGFLCHSPVTSNLGVVADPTEEPVGDTRGPPGPPSDLPRSTLVHLHLQDARGTPNHQSQLVVIVVVETWREPEALTERQGDEARPCGGGNEGEPWQIEPDRPGRWSPTDYDVQLEVLEGRVHHLLDRPWHAVDLIDEEHVALLEVREDSRQVRRSLQRRTGRVSEAPPQLVRHDAGER